MNKNLGIFDHFDFLKQTYPCVHDGLFAFVKTTGTVYLHENNAWKNTRLPLAVYEMMAKADTIEDTTESKIVVADAKVETSKELKIENNIEPAIEPEI